MPPPGNGAVDPAAETPPASAATLQALELPALLAMVAHLAATDAGHQRLLALAPTADRRRLERRRRRFEETGKLLDDGRLVRSLEEPLLPLVEALDSTVAELDGGRLLLVARLLDLSTAARRRLASAAEECPLLAAAAGELADLEPLARRIRSVLDDRGRVRENASPRLARLASGSRKLRDGLYRQLETFAADHSGELAGETVPMHGDRLVLMLRSGSRGRLDGLVHARSGTGKSYYFEPMVAVDGNNRLQESRQEETAERRRLMVELVGAAREAAPEIARHLDFVAELDGLQAAHDFAAATEGRPAERSGRHDLELLGARHPLLDPRLADLRRRALGHAGHTGAVEPLDLALDAERRVLVVTGPNAGGKTVALKTVGLLALASQCGLPIPAAAGSRLPIFERVVATVGDEQNLLEDRSTFSGRLLRLAEAWEAAGPDALVLLDELGSGTDPEEGAALAIALVEGLLERQALAIVTTHLTRLSAAALEADGALCAAMEFDPEGGSPTFRLLPGSPGASEALALARALGLPERWLDRAAELLGPEHRDLQRLLAEVERVRGEAAAELERLRTEAEAATAERRRLTEETERLEAERSAQGRKMKAELEAFRRKVRETLDEERQRLLDRLESGRRKNLVAESVERLFEAAPEPPAALPETDLPVEVGAPVEHRSLGWRGVVERIERSRAEVDVRGKRLRCRVEELVRVEAPAASERARRPAVAAPEAPAATEELHLIGQRVEPALEALDRYLDRALLAATESVRVVHGHGSGRLRRAVREHLRTHPAVARFRPGRAEEGGDGATVVTLGG